MDNIKKEDGYLVIRIPLQANRYNFYEGDDPVGTMDNVCGVIAGDELGFANWIDMDYKGKGDQVTDIFYKYYGEPDDFRLLCADLGIDVVEYPVCSHCYKAIYGCFTVDNEGDPLCLDCEESPLFLKKVVLPESDQELSEELTRESLDENI